MPYFDPKQLSTGGLFDQTEVPLWGPTVNQDPSLFPEKYVNPYTHPAPTQPASTAVEIHALVRIAWRIAESV